MSKLASVVSSVNKTQLLKKALFKHKKARLEKLAIMLDSNITMLKNYAIADDYIGLVANASLVNGKTANSFAQIDHSHEYLRRLDVSAAARLNYGGMEYLPSQFAKVGHEHDYLLKTQKAEVAKLLGGLPASNYARVDHDHGTDYHKKDVTSARRIGGLAPADLAPVDHNHYYEYVYANEPVEEADFLYDPVTKSYLSVDEFASADHNHDDRYFNKEEMAENFIKIGDPLPNAKKIRIETHNYDLDTNTNSVYVGNTNFTKLGTPGYNALETSNVYVKGDSTNTIANYGYLFTVPISVVPGSYVILDFDYPIISAFPATSSYETGVYPDKAKGPGIHELYYIVWKDTQVGVFCYDYPDVAESYMLDIVVAMDVPLAEISSAKEMVIVGSGQYDTANTSIKHMTTMGYVGLSTATEGYYQISASGLVDVRSADRSETLECPVIAAFEGAVDSSMMTTGFVKIYVPTDTVHTAIAPAYVRIERYDVVTGEHQIVGTVYIEHVEI